MRQRTVVLFAALSFSTVASSQVGSNCPARTALQLPLILDEIKNHIPDEHIVDLIDGCHVAFTLDVASLDRLSAAGASEVVMAALDRETISRMSLAQARSEVASLENAKRANPATGQNAILDRRIQAIKAGFFTISGTAPTYLNYDADASRLTAQIGATEFWFYLEPSKAQDLKTGWASAQAAQQYADNDAPERFIQSPSLAEPLLGLPRAIAEPEEKRRRVEAALVNAEHYYRARSYDKAKDEYARILGLDPADELKRHAAANEGIDSAALLKKLSDNPRSLQNTWYDAQTNLLWTVRDNTVLNPSLSADISWSGANKYCAALGVGSVKDWRVPTIKELGKLYDASKTKYLGVGFLGEPDLYHIKEDFILGSHEIWSSSIQREGIAFLYDFKFGEELHRVMGGSGVRALCARSLDAPIATTSSTPAIAPSSGGVDLAVQEGQTLCPGAQLHSFSPKYWPDRVIEIPMKITLVDGRYFQVEGSTNRYSLRSFGVQKTCSMESASAVDKAIVRVTARIGTNGDGGTFWLIREDPADALIRNGNKIPAGKSWNSFVHDECVKHDRCNEVSSAFKRSGGTEMHPDPTGTVIFPGVQPGLYHLVISRNGLTNFDLWEKTIDIKAGVTNVEGPHIK